MKRIFHFLGGIYLALFLIAWTVAFVIYGTFVEASFESHARAEEATYHNPWFRSLLFLLFINILFASLRRIPFRKKHIPFLLTHAGLLLILGGSLLKSYFGIQGIILLSEGTKTNQLTLPNKYALLFEKRVDGEVIQESLPIDPRCRNYILKHFPDTTACLIEWKPHGQMHMEKWLKEDQLVLYGFPKVPLIKEAGTYVPVVANNYHLYAIETDQINEALKKIYNQESNLVIDNSDDKKEIPLKEASFSKLAIDLKEKKATLLINFSPSPQHQLEIPLTGEEFGINKLSKTPFGTYPIDVRLTSHPSIILFKEENSEKEILVHIQENGCLSISEASPIFAYDQGYLGYWVEQTFPHTLLTKRQDLQITLKNKVLSILKKSYFPHMLLAEPIELFRSCCCELNVDFIETWFSFLEWWDAQYSWLYPIDKDLPALLKGVFYKMSLQPLPHFKSAFWSSCFFDSFERQLCQSENPIEFLKVQGWPTPLPFFLERDDFALFEELTKTFFSQEEFLPPADIQPCSITEEQCAHYYTALLRFMGIDFQNLLALAKQEEGIAQRWSNIVIRAPLTFYTENMLPPKKLETATPLVLLALQKNSQKEKVSLVFDPSFSQIKLPVFNNSLLVRFQPHSISLPFSLYLKKAIQTNYPNSSQASHYECQLRLADKNSSVQEVSLSMNHVFETKDGYRLYLSTISSPNEFGAKQVTIVVNKDPFKYLITYPGAILLVCGIFFLFWSVKR